MNRKTFLQNSSLLLTGILSGAITQAQTTSEAETVFLVLAGGVRKKDIEAFLAKQTYLPIKHTIKEVTCKSPLLTHENAWQELFSDDCFSSSRFDSIRHPDFYRLTANQTLNTKNLRIEVLQGFDCAHYNMEEYMQKVADALTHFFVIASQKNIVRVMVCSEMGRNSQHDSYDSVAGDFLHHHVPEAADTFLLFHSKREEDYAVAEKCKTTADVALLAHHLSGEKTTSIL